MFFPRRHPQVGGRYWTLHRKLVLCYLQNHIHGLCIALHQPIIAIKHLLTCDWECLGLPWTIISCGHMCLRSSIKAFRNSVPLSDWKQNVGSWVIDIHYRSRGRRVVSRVGVKMHLTDWRKIQTNTNGVNFIQHRHCCDNITHECSVFIISICIVL